MRTVSSCGNTAVTCGNEPSALDYAAAQQATSWSFAVPRAGRMNADHAIAPPVWTGRRSDSRVSGAAEDNPQARPATVFNAHPAQGRIVASRHPPLQTNGGVLRRSSGEPLAAGRGSNTAAGWV
jgi:hypothetical protein